MAEENQVMTNVEENKETTKGPKEVTTGPKEVTAAPKKVTTKNPKKVEAGDRLVEWNRKNRKARKSEVSQYYVIEVVLAVGVTGGLGYYLYQAKKGEVNVEPQSPQRSRPKFEMDYSGSPPIRNRHIRNCSLQ